MSTNSDNVRAASASVTSSGNAPGRAIEPWFSVLLFALLPLFGGLVSPASWRTPLHFLGGVLCVLGLALLVRHEMALRRDRNVTDQ